MPNPDHTPASTRIGQPRPSDITGALIPEAELTSLWFDLDVSVKELSKRFMCASGTLYKYVAMYDLPPRRYLESVRNLRKIRRMCCELLMPLDVIATTLGMSEKALDRVLSFHSLDHERAEAMTTGREPVHQAVSTRLDRP